MANSPFETRINTVQAAELNPFENPPPGWKFEPNDVECLQYLEDNSVGKKKHPGLQCAIIDIPCTDGLCQHDPWNLPRFAKNTVSHYIHHISRRYTKGNRITRRTPSGYWRKTGKDHSIYQNGVEIGMKKILVFYTCKDTKTKTKWVMHEYHRSDATSTNAMEVFCKVFYQDYSRKSNKGNSNQDLTYGRMVCSASTKESESIFGGGDGYVLGNLDVKTTPVKSSYERNLLHNSKSLSAGGHSTEISEISEEASEYAPTVICDSSFACSTIKANVEQQSSGEDSALYSFLNTIDMPAAEYLDDSISFMKGDDIISSLLQPNIDLSKMAEHMKDIVSASDFWFPPVLSDDGTRLLISPKNHQLLSDFAYMFDQRGVI